MGSNQRIVIIPDEPVGIGPDLVAALAQKAWQVELVICAAPALLTARAPHLGLPLRLHPYRPEQPATPRSAGELTVLAIKASAPVVVGELNVANSHYITWSKCWPAPAMTVLTVSSRRCSRDQYIRASSTMVACHSAAIRNISPSAVAAKGA